MARRQCPRSEDGQHCKHYHDDEQCHFCGLSYEDEIRLLSPVEAARVGEAAAAPKGGARGEAAPENWRLKVTIEGKNWWGHRQPGGWSDPLLARVRGISLVELHAKSKGWLLDWEARDRTTATALWRGRPVARVEAFRV